MYRIQTTQTTMTADGADREVHVSSVVLADDEVVESVSGELQWSLAAGWRQVEADAGRAVVSRAFPDGRLVVREIVGVKVDPMAPLDTTP